MKNCLEGECITYKDKRCCLKCKQIKVCISPCDLIKNNKDILDCAYMINEESK
jgi:hypothetical protein